MAAPLAMADQCEDSAKPKQFNKDTAMEAIFCEYNREHGGTLLPLENTRSWDIRSSDTLVTPILTATYLEGNVQKGVLALQRQMLESTGEPVASHGQQATVSVYVFRFDGERWVFEKGKTTATEAGTYGSAPDGRLAKIGPDKYGILFEGGWAGQGYFTSYALIVNLSGQTILEAGAFDTGQSNSGACAEEPEQQEGAIGACWSYEGRPEFIAAQGSPYYMLRIAYQGTESGDVNLPEEVAPKDDPVCYTLTGRKYVEARDPSCASYQALDAGAIFGGTEEESRTRPGRSR